MGLFGKKRKPKAKKELYGYQVAGRYNDYYTFKPAKQVIRHWLIKCFRWPVEEAERFISQEEQWGHLDPRKLAREGIVLSSFDGTESYRLVHKRLGCWKVTMLSSKTVVL